MPSAIFPLFYHWLLKFPSPKIAHFVIQTISAIFEGLVITEGFGKITSPSRKGGDVHPPPECSKEKYSI